MEQEVDIESYFSDDTSEESLSSRHIVCTDNLAELRKHPFGKNQSHSDYKKVNESVTQIESVVESFNQKQLSPFTVVSDNSGGKKRNFLAKGPW